MAITTQMRTDVANLYVSLFGRAPERDGLGFWVQQLDAGRTVAQVAEEMYNTAPARATYPTFLTNQEIVAKFYANVLGRTADAEGLAFWTAKLNAGASKGALIAEMIGAVQSYAGTDAAALASKSLLANKVAVSLWYAVDQGGNDVSAASAILSQVTSAASSVDAIKAGTSTGTVGSTFTLTSGVDNLTGTNGNDTFVADNTNAAKQISAADTVTGGNGTDTLKVFLAAADTGFTAPQLSSIETVYINGGAVAAYTAAAGTTGLVIDAAVQPAATTYTLSGQALTLQNLKPGQATTTTIASTADTVENITLNNVTTGTTATWLQTIDLSGTKQATLNLTATGAASTITLTNTGAALTALNIAGDKALTVTESLASVKTINASANSAGVTVDVSGATMVPAFAFTGGSGNDTLTVAAGQLASAALTSGAQIDLGAGTDTLVIKDTTPVYTTINAIKGLDVVQAGVTGATFDMSLLTPSQVAFSSVAAGTVSNLEATDSVTVKGAMATSLTVGGAVGNSTGTINIGTATTTGFTVASLVTTGLTNVAISSNGTNAAANVITAMTNSDNSAFTITGSNDLTLAVTAGATVTGDKIDASAFTGKLNATGSNLADILIGGSAADTLTGGTGSDVLTGNGGADTFAFAAGSSGSAFGNFDEIKDFLVGTDKLQFTGVVDVVSGQQTAVQAAVTALASTATAAQIATAMATANTTDLGVSFATFGGNTYVLFETTGASTGVVGADAFIKLTGVSVVPTFAVDVIA